MWTRSFGSGVCARRVLADPRSVGLLRRSRADGILRGYFEVEVAVEADLSAITPIMLVLLWRRRLYGGWRYYAITN